jgi:ligand-binding SRPBCC domain-containing protein
MIDEVQYKLPLAAAGRLVAGAFVESDVRQIFAYRRRVIAGTQF